MRGRYSPKLYYLFGNFWFVCLVTFGLFVLVTFGLVTLGCFNQEGMGLHFITMVYMASCGVGHVCHSHWRADVSL